MAINNITQQARFLTLSPEPRAGFYHQNGSPFPDPQADADAAAVSPTANGLNVDKQDETTPLLGKTAGIVEQYSVFTNTQKKILILSASLASTFSPLSSNIYYPALNSIANDLGVTLEMVNLTITSYMVFQAFTPTIAGSFSDTIGRRPVYVFCFIVYIGSNIALGVSHSYPALLVLRGLQSMGSSATIALSNAIAADLVVSSERGNYMGLASLGGILAPSLGPILGGTLSEYFGWHAIFVFLAIASGVFFVPFVMLYPETSRTVVGDGSREAPWWNRPILALILGRHKSHSDDEERASSPQESRLREPVSEKRQFVCPNPFGTLRLLFELPTGPILLANGLVYAAYFAVTSSMPALLRHKYGLTDFQIGLSYVPSAVGSVAISFISGRLLDWNFRRWAAKDGYDVTKLAKRNQEAVQIERARLQIGIPMTYACAVTTLAYGWALSYDASLAVIMVLLFCIGCSMTACYSIMNLLIVDVNYGKPATATAANNLVRCMLGAGSTAAVGGVLQRLGIGPTFTAVCGVMVASTLLTWTVYRKGRAWRQSRVAG